MTLRRAATGSCRSPFEVLPVAPPCGSGSVGGAYVTYDIHPFVTGCSEGRGRRAEPGDKIEDRQQMKRSSDDGAGVPELVVAEDIGVEGRPLPPEAQCSS